MFFSKTQKLTRNDKVQSPGSSPSGLFHPETLFKMQARSWEKNPFFSLSQKSGVMTLEMSNQTRCPCWIFSSLCTDVQTSAVTDPHIPPYTDSSDDVGFGKIDAEMTTVSLLDATCV